MLLHVCPKHFFASCCIVFSSISNKSLLFSLPESWFLILDSYVPLVILTYMQFICYIDHSALRVNQATDQFCSPPMLHYTYNILAENSLTFCMPQYLLQRSWDLTTRSPVTAFTLRRENMR